MGFQNIIVTSVVRTSIALNYVIEKTIQEYCG